MTDGTARVTVESYFDLIRDGDLGVADLFHDDARLVGLGTVIAGRDAIREFYEASIDASRPQPRLLGPLLVEGDRVAAEIGITLSNGDVLHVVDLFLVEDDRIRSLTYFVADHP